MPGKHKCLITFDFRNSDPFLHLHFGPVFLMTLMNLKEIMEAVLLIHSSQGKQPAETGTERMNGTSAFFIQKATAFSIFSQLQVRKNYAVRHVQFDSAFLQQGGKCRFQAAAKLPYIIRVQNDGVSRFPAAGRTARAVPAANLHQILRAIQLPVRHFRQINFPLHPYRSFRRHRRPFIFLFCHYKLFGTIPQQMKKGLTNSSC